TFEQLVEAAGGPFAPLVDNQIAGDGEEPGFEPRLDIELTATDENPHPDLLEEVCGHLAVSGEKKQVAQQPVLIADDQLVEQACFLSFETVRDRQALLPGLLVLGTGHGMRKQRFY